MTTTAGPAQLVLSASVARRYYVEGRSKVEIGQEFGLSRFKVARLLENARETGLVRIDIRYPGVVDVELSSRLQGAYGLRHAIVIDVPDEAPAVLRQHLGEAAAELLSEIVTTRDVLGLAWARSVSAMAGALTHLPAVPVVQLTGALSRPDASDSSIEVVRDVAKVSGGRAYFFYAPLIVGDASTAQALRRQPEVARTFDQLPSVTKAMVGIGLCQLGQSTVYDAIGDRERRHLRRLGVCADISGIFIDREGHLVLTELADRMIGVSAAQLRPIPEVLAIVYGPAKTPAVRAALSGGLVNSLVTHAALANALLGA
jgi:DNA-binding transcriptional regulator LsrR (DeoR family)